MSADLTRRPSRPRRRCLIRSLLGAALAVAGVLVPLEAPALPDSPVLAQTNTGDQGDGNPPNNGGPGDQPNNGGQGPGTDNGDPNTGGEDPVSGVDAVVSGESDECEEPWRAQDINGPVCVLEVDACPYDRVKYDENDPSIQRLRPSVEFDPDLMDAGELLIGIYAGFCEARHFSQSDPTAYEACTDPEKTRGFIVRTHVMERPTDEEDNPVLDEHNNPVVHRLCRIVYPASCTVGSHVEPYKCKAVRRRTWSCPDDYVPRNVFNTCYQPLDRPADPHPACADGAPELVAVDCGDYAGTDYTSDGACDGFDTGSTTIRLKPNNGNPYWCTFNASLLRVACRGNTRCTPDPAFCLKRASGTGGCNAIAETIRCRGLQAESNSADELREAGCQPCLLLPFEPPPTDCPPDILDEPGQPSGSPLRDFEEVHERKTSYFFGGRACSGYRARPPRNTLEECLQAPGACASPPAGRLRWASSHFSGLAVVNSPVVLTVEDALAGISTAVGISERTYVDRADYSYLAAQGGSGGVITRWPIPDPSRTWGSVFDVVEGVRGQVARGSGPCFYRGGYTNPLFRVTVEQLWPDYVDPEQRADHGQEIERLFGENALDWWNELDADESDHTERRRRTTARGLSYFPDLGSEEEREQEIEARVSEVNCNWNNSSNYGSQIWCRWTPSVAGYYRFTVAGAWKSQKRDRIRLRTDRDYDVLSKLQSPEGQEEIRRLLDDLDLSEKDAGLNDQLTGFLPMPAVPAGKPEEAGYVTPTAACPSVDVRFICAGGSEARNYTVSEPIGIMVHEVRVATRSPLLRTPPPR